MNIKEFFEKEQRVAVAFSGGVDSAVLLALAKEYAKEVKAYYVKTAFQPAFELKDAQDVAAKLGVALTVIIENVLANAAVTANPENRCYHCKRMIFGAICGAARNDGFDTVLDGTNADDNAAERPGMKALKELKVLSPLRECGYTKADVRNEARKRGLSVAEKPSYACLATRIPTGTRISASLLHITEESENELMALGLKDFRVRYLNGDAKLQLSHGDFEKLPLLRKDIYAILSRYYHNVYLDLKERVSDG